MGILIIQFLATSQTMQTKIIILDCQYSPSTETMIIHRLMKNFLPSTYCTLENMYYSNLRSNFKDQLLWEILIRII